MKWTWSAIGVVVTLSTAVGATGLRAQGEGTASIPMLAGPVAIDGDAGDAAWAEVPTLQTSMYLPTFKGEVTEATSIRVAHDGRYLYILGDFTDSDPSGVRVNSLYRDRWSGDDVLAVFIDPFNDNENGLWFMTNAAGIRLDAELSDDGRTQNLSWNTFWDVESRLHDRGWTTEMRIPFSSLGFQSLGGEVVMGIALTRLVARKNERVTYPAIDPQYGFRQPSVFQDVRLEGVDASSPIYLTGYGLGATSRSPFVPAGASEWDTRTSSDAEFGVDAKLNLSSNFTLDLTVNPDFAQVEADDQQINLTRFSLFFPEKRQFFQERSALFTVQSRNGSRIFNSRRIGLSDAREPVRILGGGRLVGRVGEWDVGVINMQTEGVAGGDASTNFGVARVRRRVLNDFSWVGAMATTRYGATGQGNAVVALDAEVRLWGDDYLSALVSQTRDEELGSQFSHAGAREVEVSLLRPNTRGLNYRFSFTRTGASYRPGIGFVARPGVDRVDLYTQYFHYLDDASPVRYLLPGAFVTRFDRTEDGSLQSAAYRAWVTVAMKNGSSGFVEPEYFEEDVRRPFELGDGVRIEPGRYSFGHVWLNWGTGFTNALRATFSTRIGRFYDGRRVEIGVTPTWNVSRHLELGGSLQSNFLDFEERGESLATHLARLRVEAALNVQTSMNAFVQWNSATDELAANIRVRHNFREGTDLWVVLNQGVVTDRDPLEPGLARTPLAGPTTLIVKYSHTFGG